MRLAASVLFFASLSGLAQTPPAPAPQKWVAVSDRNAHILIDALARHQPESATSQGVPGLDEQISGYAAGNPEKLRADLRSAQTELQARLALEQDPLVKQDLGILIAAAGREIRESEADENTFLPYADPASHIFFGLKTLLDEQTNPTRRPAALVRLRKYLGLEPGTESVIAQAQARFREKLATPGLLGPPRAEVEKKLGNTAAYLSGISLLFERFRIVGYQDAVAQLKSQLTDYDDFVRREVLPRSRTDFRLPPAIYQIQLEGYGVDYTPDELQRIAHAGFREIQAEMQKVARRVARQRGFKQTDYRQVIATLKKDQLPGDQVLSHYEMRLRNIEAILREKDLITLPDRPAIIKLATAAETAQQPAPHMQPAALLNNHGERGAFVLPLETSGEGGAPLKYDDFTFGAASWTLTSHEARPGHELQFDAMIEKGVSLARAMFAFNSTNVEGWGLYAEWFMLPYMPDEGKLISLQHRLMRAARAFLDPELQQGTITREQAMKVLQEDVVLSKGLATEEIERYTFRAPGQAVSYYDGFTRLLEIRRAAEKAIGPRFNQKKFHDFVLGQGLLPPALLRKAVMEDFVLR